MEMLEEITAAVNLNKAFKKVRKNNGAGGVDRMEVKELQPYLKTHGEELVRSILDGSYRPNPVRRVENGKTRGLGIPTAVDRVFQQAIAQVLTPVYEPEFAETSYGFRPGRSTHDAIRKCLEYANEGYTWTVDMDLEKFFDTVNQDKLTEILSGKIKDGRVISLIRKYLKAGVMVGKEYRKSDMGVPQGGNLSPLLANVMLNELDHELERRGHRFVRYADDMVIFCKSKASARQTLEHILPFIERKLFLRVNREKTKVADIGRIKFLGYGFRYTAKGVRATVHTKSKAKLKAKVKEITKRSDGRGYEWKKRKLRQIVTGWVNYFKLADMKTWLEAVDEWMRTRLRTYIWKSWKTIKNKYRNLRKLGATEKNAGRMANTRKGYRRSADSPIVKLAISKELLKRAGYTFFLDYYLSRKA
jgi:RNA-directed DNA polymerase